MRRLYYMADDLPTTRALLEALHEEGISDWHFHVVAKDGTGLYRHHATPIQQLDIVHTGERWALVGGVLGFGLGMLAYLTKVLPWEATGLTVVLVTCAGALLGAWQGGLAGLSREHYKLEPYHEDIEAGRFLMMVDVKADEQSRVHRIMNMGFPSVRYCGKDTTFINPFKSPRKIYAQDTS